MKYPPPSNRKNMLYKYGWRYGGDGHNLYVTHDYFTEYPEQVIPGWGVTQDFRKGTYFHSIRDCIDHWRSIHSFPEHHEECIYNGYLQFFTQDGQQLIW